MSLGFTSPACLPLLPQPLATLDHLKTQQREHTEAVVPVEERVPWGPITPGTACALLPVATHPTSFGPPLTGAAGCLVRQGEPDVVSVHFLCVHVSNQGAELALMLGGLLERAGNWGLGGLGVASRLHSARALGALPFAPW